MDKKHITIHDIARELKVSASTVSRALQNHPRISPETKKAVTKLAAHYKYVPNVVASSLRKGKGKAVGVIVPRINRNFFSNVIGGMEEKLTTSGFHLIICQTQEQLKNEEMALQTLVNARVDAVFLSISMETTTKEHIRMLIDRGIRLFFFDRVYEGINTGSVMIDDRLGAYLNVKHLLEQGYQRIIHVAGSDRIRIYRERKAGYLEAMNEAGIEVPPSWVMERSLILEGGESAFKTGLEMATRPDAYFCAGDYAAVGIIQAALDHGLNIPGDLGVTGFANEPFTAFMNPSLTSVDQRAGEMGRMVANMFLQCENEGTEPSACEKIVLKPELIIRKSSLKNI